jgi:formylglycine-generating enzyme required for sulfatase activity
MSRGRHLAVACLVAAAALPTTLRGQEPKLKIIASTSDTEPVLIRLKKDNSGVVIRSAQELVAHGPKPDVAKPPTAPKEAEAGLAMRLKVDKIDWGKQMILAVQGRPTRGEAGSIRFDAPKITGKVLRIMWTQQHRVTRAPNQGPPIGIALVDRFEGEVRFLARSETNSIGMHLLLIPEGKFVMGSPKGEEDRLDEELPHEVEIMQPFYLGKHEVTVGQFKAFVKDTNYKTEAEKDGKGGRAFDGKEFVQRPDFTWKKLHFTQMDDHPVVVVSWNDAMAFCAWLSKKEGKTYRLPTEAEWEYACRAETNTRFSAGDKDIDLKMAGNIADATLKMKWKEAFWTTQWDDGFPFTAPVGKFRANDFGLHDMHGNVWEWCSDWYDENYYGKSPKQDPQGPGRGKERVLRGGAWSTQPKFCRCAFRDWHEPEYRSDCVGFRIVVATTKE